MAAKFVQGRLEVIEDNAIGKALEDKSKFPERVDDANWNHRDHGQKVDDDANNTESHAEKQDAETRRHSDNLDEAKLVAEHDIPEEIDNGEYPPRISGC
jgi:hypothetical protein